MTTERWTQADEIKLESMMKRKMDIMSKNREPVIQLAADIEKWGAMDRADKLISNAKYVRGILEPFDDNFRPIG